MSCDVSESRMFRERITNKNDFFRSCTRLISILSLLVITSKNVSVPSSTFHKHCSIFQWKFAFAKQNKKFSPSCIGFQVMNQNQNHRKSGAWATKSRKSWRQSCWQIKVDEGSSKNRYEMIQLKCAELLFLMWVVMCGTESDFSANNKPFTANRVDGELIGSGGGSSDDRFMFTTMRC